MQEEAPAPAPDPLAVAAQLLQRGDYAGAGTAYTATAPGLPAADGARAYALAALAFQDAGDDAHAATALTALAPGSETSEPYAALAQARAQLQAGHADVALALASKINASALSAYGRGVQTRLIAASATALSDFATAVPAWLQAFQLPYPGSQQNAITQSTWTALKH